MSQINAYIHFNNNCQEAMEFYRGCLGGELTIMKVKDSPMASQCPAGMQEQALHAMLVKDSMVLMGSDMISPEGRTQGNNIALSLNCDSESDIQNYYNRLSENGKIIDPLKQQFWGALFGVVEDKYGIRWMLNYELPKN